MNSITGLMDETQVSDLPIVAKLQENKAEFVDLIKQDSGIVGGGAA